ncbi:MAG: 5-(carboxyamino)imidazole ribonucleotide synthase [Bacteroidota bacterium]
MNSFPILGVLGGGQLGRMTALAAIPMGVHVRFLVPASAASIAPFADVTVGDWTDAEVLRAFAEGCDAVTVESEWAPADLLAAACPDVPVWPAPATLQTIRHKGRQRTTLAEAGLPGPAFARCATLDDARAALDTLGLPVVAKRFEGSYDGYGNATVRTPDDLDQAWADLAAGDGLLLEAFVPFVRELAVLVARRPGGDTVVYPVVETEQRDHRLHACLAPAPIAGDVAAEARRVALRAVEAVSGVGITAVELFETEDGQVLVNELAPRPHNSGHYTIEGCHTSQFANHARAVLDLPLGDPSLRASHVALVNVLGHRASDSVSAQGLDEALRVEGSGVHLYGKAAVRPKRKMGHVTVLGSEATDVRARAERAAAALRL